MPADGMHNQPGPDLCHVERVALKMLAQAVLDARKELQPLSMSALDRVSGIAEQIVNPKGARP